MCGFLYTHSQTPITDAEIQTFSHRGLPGYHGLVRTREGRNFCHVALPFVNLDPAVAIQPRTSERNQITMFVGEIFNYESLGSYSSDTDAISDIFFREGLRGFHKFDGFWSFLSWDGKDLVAAVDYLAQKPLYYRTDIEAIASEIDTLRALGPVTQNKTYLSNVLKWGYDPRDETPWKEIRSIPPGHALVNGSLVSYWDWTLVPKTDLRSDLISSVRLRLGGQREVSLLLSGGLDSSIIYGLIKKELDRRVHLFHVENEERDWARLVAEWGGGDDPMTSVTPEEVTEEEAIRAHQTPVDLGSVRPQLAMAKALRGAGSYAVLSGDGADELFGGYRRSKEYDSQASDVFMELPYYHLPRLDRIMMNQTIELRAPFLSPSVIAHALDVPWSLRQGEKTVLKTIFADLVPPEILSRDKLPLKTKEIRQDPFQARIRNSSIWKSLNDQ